MKFIEQTKPFGRKFHKAADHNQLTGAINAKIIAYYSPLHDDHSNHLYYSKKSVLVRVEHVMGRQKLEGRVEMSTLNDQPDQLFSQQY